MRNRFPLFRVALHVSGLIARGLVVTGLYLTGLACSATVLCLASAGEEAAPRKVLLSSPITHSDWMLHNPAQLGGRRVSAKSLIAAKRAGGNRFIGAVSMAGGPATAAG